MARNQILRSVCLEMFTARIQIPISPADFALSRVFGMFPGDIGCWRLYIHV